MKGVVFAYLLAALPRSLTRGPHRHRDDLLPTSIAATRSYMISTVGSLPNGQYGTPTTEPA
jgi:hypothetical protein